MVTTRRAWRKERIAYPVGCHLETPHGPVKKETTLWEIRLFDVSLMFQNHECLWSVMPLFSLFSSLRTCSLSAVFPACANVIKLYHIFKWICMLFCRLAWLRTYRLVNRFTARDGSCWCILAVWCKVIDTNTTSLSYWTNSTEDQLITRLNVKSGETAKVLGVVPTVCTWLWTDWLVSIAKNEFCNK